LDYRCFEPACKSPSNACIICLKKSHRWCSSEHILFQKAQYNQQIAEIQVENTSLPLKQLTIDKLEPILPSVSRHLGQLADLSLTPSNKGGQSQALAFRRLNKNLYEIEVDPKTSKVILKQKKIDKEDLKEAAEIFETSINSAIDSLIKGIAAINLRTHDGPSVDSFRFHDSLSLTQLSGAFHMMLLNTVPNYYCCVTTKPIKNRVVVKIKVLTIDPANRFMEVGLMTNADYSADPDNFILGSSYGNYSFSGFAQTGFTGDLPTTEPASDLGLKEGTTLTFTYDRTAKIVSVVGDSNINLTADLIDDKEDYHLYFLLRSHNQAIQFEYTLDPTPPLPE
jgi:hypothetical protein